MSKKYVVRTGECVASIAYDHGLHPNTVWNHQQNQSLKEQRGDSTVLRVEDLLLVSDRTLKEIEKLTDPTHVLIHRGVPEAVRIRFLDQDNQPRADLRYALNIDGENREGKTDGEGFVKAYIAPNAKARRLTLYDERGNAEEYLLELSHLPPLTELIGVQMRLTSLGSACKSENGVFSELTRASVRRFQEDHALLSATGEPDEAPRAALKAAYGA